jgi:hypothetical protein
MASITCTKCAAVLKTKAPVAPGKKLKCPKCAQVFVVEDEEVKVDAAPDEDMDADQEDQEAEKPKAGKKAAKKRQDEEETAPDDGEDEPKKKKAKKKPAKASPMILVIGGILVLLLCLVGGGGAAGWFFFIRQPNVNTDPLVKGKGDDSKVNPGNDKTAKPADFTVTAESITQEQFTDANAYSAKYKDKVVEVTGEVHNVDIDRFRLKGILDPKTSYVKTVNCEIPTKDWDKSHLLARGQKVKVTGKAEVFFKTIVELKNCSFVELESAQLRKVTAEEIAKAMNAGGENKAIEERLNALDFAKGAIVTGAAETVFPRNPNMTYQHRMHLNMPTKTRLELIIEVPRKEMLPTKGQTIEFRTTTGVYYIGKELRLSGILLSVK